MAALIFLVYVIQTPGKGPTLAEANGT